MNAEKINFRQSRDFGETFNISVKFLRQNFKLFFQSLIFIAGPFVVISAIAGAFYQSNAISMFTITRMGPIDNILNQFGWAYLIFIFAAIIANITLVGTVFSYMINYMEKGPGGFTVNDVGKTFIQNLGNILAVFFSLTFLAGLIAVVIFGIIIGITSAIPILGVLLILATVIGLLILLPPLMWQLSVVYLIKMQENKGVFDSFRRAREVMRDNFWWTWLIIVCALFAIGLISLVFTFPQMIYQMILMISHLKGGNDEASVSFLIVASICTFCTTLLYGLLYVINAFHYYSLAEKKDGIGLMERINEIGKMPENNVNQQY